LFAKQKVSKANVIYAALHAQFWCNYVVCPASFTSADPVVIVVAHPSPCYIMNSPLKLDLLNKRSLAPKFKQEFSRVNVRPALQSYESHENLEP
jgi:hypothetical protein